LYDREWQIRHCIFDHDGTLSTLREGWESVMEPMMVRSILGYKDGEIAAEERDLVTRRVRQFIDRTTGVQTLAQMAGLVELVREFGLVADEEILDPKGYKEIYNNALMERVRRRMRDVEQGPQERERFIIPGARSFLRALDQRGVVLYLASGTDIEDVEREAELMGYAELFTGGIYGAVGRLDVEAKRQVIQDIIARTGESDGSCIMVVGDGPVEIREGVRVGALTVGVASDEKSRSGINHVKRSRVIRAGANIVVPDFREADMLLRYLGERGGVS
jgi:phosphoglycolate phosphatase-like HAD superfamily hydrolase